MSGKFNKAVYAKSIENLTIGEVQNRMMVLGEVIYEPSHQKEMLKERRTELFLQQSPDGTPIQDGGWEFGMRRAKKPRFKEIRDRDDKVAKLILDKYAERIKISPDDLEEVLKSMKFSKAEIEEFLEAVSVLDAPAITTKKL